MTTETSLAEIDQIERSFVANLDQGENALAAAETDYERLQVRDAARAAQVITAVMGRRKLVRRFSVLVQRAERAIAQANPPMSFQESQALGQQAKNGEYTSGDYLKGGTSYTGEDVPPSVLRGQLDRFRAAHSHLSDEEFEELASEDTDDPMTRKQLIDIGREKRSQGRVQEDDEGDHHIAFQAPDGAEMYDESDVRDVADSLYEENQQLRERLATYEKQPTEREERPGERPLALPESPDSVQRHNKAIWNIQHLPVEADFYTIGYSGRDIQQFVGVLRAVGVSTLVDIRHAPVSQYKPDFSKENLKNCLAQNGIAYIHKAEWGVPREVRSLSVDQDSRDAIWDWYDLNVVPKLRDGELADIQESAKLPLAFMCSELDPTACHRHRLFLTLEKSGLRGFDL